FPRPRGCSARRRRTRRLRRAPRRGDGPRRRRRACACRCPPGRRGARPPARGRPPPRARAAPPPPRGRPPGRGPRAASARPHRLEVEAARVALVGEGRIREAVAEDDLPRVERGPDDLTYVLRAVRAVEEELGERRQRGGVGAEQEAANGGPGRRAARLARL